MKVHQLRLVMGKTTNYDQNGKLKNSTVTSKYAGEMELENILGDKAWQKLGACEISCVNAYDSATPNVSDVELINATNARIKKDIQAGTKPKTEIELLREQVAVLTEKINNPVIPVKTDGIDNPFENIKTDISIPKKEPVETTEKEIRKHLFEEAEELGLTPAKNVKTDILKDLVAKAKQ